MAAVNISQVGNNVQLEEAGVIIAMIPSRSFRFEPEQDGDFIIIRDFEALQRVRQYQASEINDGAGAPVGNLAAVISYLAPFVGFNPAAGGGGEANTSSNSGPGAGLALPKVGVDLPFKSLVAGAGVTITPLADSIQIDATGAGGGEVNTSSNLGTGEGVAAPKSGVDLPFKSLVAAGSVALSSDANEITITGDGEPNTNSNQGTGEGLAMAKVGDDLPLKTLKAGTNITLTPSADEILIDAAAGAGEANTASNEGLGFGLVLPKVGVNLPFKSIVEGTGISITSAADSITIEADNQGGEANTSSSSGGNSLVLPKVGVDLPFKGIEASSSKIGITVNPTTLGIDVNEGNIVHQNISGAGVNTHAQIDSHIGSTANPHSVTKAQVGLSNVDNLQQIPLTEKGAANGVATLDAGSKIPSAQLPAVAISETFVVGSQAAQTALVAQVGDVAVRTDESKSYILQTEPASIFGNWVELLTPAAPVISVNGQTGSVSLSTTDISEGTNLYFTDARVAANAAVAANTAKVTNATHTGDVTGDQALTIAANAVTNGKAADMAANTVKTNPTAALADPQDLAMPPSTILARLATGNIVAATVAQIQTLISAVASALNLGAGAGQVFASKVGSQLQFRSLKAGTGVSISQTATEITITGNGAVMFETPAILNADVDNYNPTNWATANYFRQGTNGNNFITGLTALPSGTERRFINLGPGDLRFAHDDPASLAANRIFTPNEANLTLQTQGSALLVYDGISSRWRIIQNTP